MTRITIAKSIGWFIVFVLMFFSITGYFFLIGSDVDLETRKKMMVSYAVGMSVAGFISLIITDSKKSQKN